MTATEIAVGLVPGAPARLGTVVARDVGRGNRQVQVRWADGTEEFVGRANRTVLYRSEHSALHRWLCDPAELRTRFAADPAAVFLTALRDLGGALNCAELTRELTAAGLDQAAVSGVWKSTVQKIFKTHQQVRVDGARYQWSAESVDPHAGLRGLPAAQALARLTDGSRLTAAQKAALAEAVRAGLHPGDQPSPSGVDDQEIRAAQDRQLRVDGARAVAEIAMEIEELAFNGADADLIVERVRVLVEMASLTPIALPGQQVPFDPARHSSLAGFPDAGSAVTVIRPGYFFRTRGEDVLLGKAIVADI